MKKSKQGITVITLAACAGGIILLFATLYLILSISWYGLAFLLGLPTVLQGDTNLIWYFTSCALMVGFLALLLFIMSKNVEYLTNLYHHYQNTRQERKRIERLIQKDETTKSNDNILLHVQDDEIAHQNLNH